VKDEAVRYSAELGVAVPHTTTTFKPAGTTSKLFGLTEGAHLPSMRWYLRWVQFRWDDPLVEDYRSKGYPVRELRSYEGTTIVGFPTALPITELDGGEWIVTAAEATPEEQYQFLRLLEKHWVDNQVSYTLKYDPKKVSFPQFLETLIEGQFTIKCCSVMPQVDATAYEYQPEEPISKERYEELVSIIEAAQEDVDFEHLDCSSGACPIDFNK
jgi:ribonucleoside-triphosphate reductase (formate)